MAPWTLRGSEAFELRSTTLGEDYAIGVVRPIPDPDEPAHVVYVLDGAMLLATAAVVSHLQRGDGVRDGFPPLLLVGIDYPEGQVNRRSRDFTMPDSVWPPMVPELSKSELTRPGGAEGLLRFLEDELHPLIRSRYPTVGTTAGILGASFGGTFAFYAFVQQSRLFDRFWLGSPGIFTTGTDHVADFEAVVAGKLVAESRMFLSMGEVEETGPVDFYADLAVNFRRIQKVLESTPNPRLTYSSQVYPHKTHMSVVPHALADALLALYGT